MLETNRTNERTDPLGLLLDSPPTRAAHRQSPPTGNTDTDGPTRTKGLRADIQGLRAIAVMMVLLYHGRLPFIKGGFAGVDVFFVISGYLITGLMVRELERTGRLSLRNFWARRAKRLLPATAIVLVAVTVLSLMFLPQVRWAVTAGDIIAAALYVVNWRLASQSLDYLAQNYAASPVQHFWSLAVEEQFYVIWPVLIVIIAALGRRFGWPLRRTLLIGVTALTVPSLIWSIHLTSGQTEAYFITTTRAWELGIGATVALLAARLDRQLPRVAAQAITWLGVLTLAGVALFLPDSLPWPGWAALIPTLATAAVIAGGPAAGPGGATYLIGRPPFRWIGDLSYSLYLWHFPLIVFATAHWHDKLGPRHGMLVIALSFVPAYLTYRFLESPLHHSRTLAKFPVRALALGAACTVIGVIAGLVLNASIPHPKPVPLADRPGAGALISNLQTAIPRDNAASITPDPLKARDDLPDLYARGCQSNYVKSVPTPCEFGDPAAKTTVMLIGDSRAAQWSPALQAVAEQQHWRVVTVTKAGCPFANVVIVKGPRNEEKPYTSCTSWNAKVLKLIQTGPYHPKFVLTSAYYPYQTSIDGQVQRGAQNQQALINGFRSTWTTLYQEHIPVIAIRETPLMGRDVAECVSNNRDSLHKCGTKRDKALRTAHIMQPAAKDLPGAVTIDLTLNAVCPAKDCPAVIGNVLIYRDEHHLTATYSRSTAPFLSQALAALRGTNFASGTLDKILPST